MTPPRSIPPRVSDALVDTHACLNCAAPLTGPELESQARTRLQRQPDDPAALADLARALAWQQRWDEAQALYERLLAATSDDADHLLGLA